MNDTPPAGHRPALPAPPRLPIPEATTTSDVLTPSTSSSSGSFDTDVLVVGAGPIGLITAAALRHHGVACRVVEQRAETKAIRGRTTCGPGPRSC